MERKPLKGNKGFTLIEIIVVLIIVGIVAAIALPSYFRWTYSCRAGEALGNMTPLKDSLVTCLRTHVGNEISCFPACPPGSLGCDTATTTSQNFSYFGMNRDCTSLPTGGSCQEYASSQQYWMVQASDLNLANNGIYLFGTPNDSLAAVCFGFGQYYTGVC